MGIDSAVNRLSSPGLFRLVLLLFVVTVAQSFLFHSFWDSDDLDDDSKYLLPKTAITSIAYIIVVATIAVAFHVLS
ncbi:hypothetical protein [Halorussus halophilus]|uniref:hypothetical protein n=1 Tax=Halorussus halophilus TaxID=2650975 RepID=UPI001300DFB8|nr:hypothetical protein [Halorussus halophilus]